MTLDAVPPAQAPTISIPIVNSSDRLKAFDNSTAVNGITVNCMMIAKAIG
jgi:hypothetical protein